MAINRRSIVTAGLGTLLTAVLTAKPAPISSTGLALSFQSRPPAPYVLAVNELNALMQSSTFPIRMIDVSPLRRYRDGHIPGAIHEYWEDTVDREYPHFGAVVTQGDHQQQRIDFVRKLSIEPDTYVVAYDDQSGFRAARIVWYLRFLGFEQVSLLDGGLRAWEEAGLPVELGVNTVQARSTASVTPREGYYLVTRQLLDRLESQNLLVVDTRTDEEQQDDLDGSIRTGTIPGSVWFPWTNMTDVAAHRLRDPDQLAAELEQAGLAMDRDIVLFARFGVDASLPWLVLKHLGYPNAVTYDRGWVEWASRPDLEAAPL